MASSKKALITGAGGFIGAHTVAHLMHNTNWEIVCLDSFRHKGKTDRLTQMLESNPEWRERIKVITHDLAAPISAQLAARIGKIDYILNLASESHVDRSITDPVPFVQNNVNLVLNMLEYARRVKPLYFMQISTDEVYGPAPDGVNFQEWSTILPSNPYAASKAAQEAICISYWRSYGVPLVITNTMNNFGEMQDNEKFIPMLIKDIAAGKKVTIHGNKSYIGSRFYLHARNHADALLFIINNLPPVVYEDTKGQSLPSRYNVVGAVEVTNLEMAEAIADILGKKLKYELVDFHQTRPGHDRRYALDGTLLSHMGWKMPVDTYDSLKQTVAWTLGHPEWLLGD